LVKPGGTVVSGTLPTSPDLGLIWNGAPMHATLKLRESDPHDDFGIAPEVVPVSWADKVLADIARDANSHVKSYSRRPASVQPPAAESGAAARAMVPTVDTTFRATAVDDVPDVHTPSIDVGSERPAGVPPGRKGVKKAVTVFLFALCSAFAAAAWQHYGGAARQMIAAWTPPFVLTALPPTEKTGLTAPSDTPAVEAAATDPAAPPDAAAAQPADGPAPVATAPSPDAAQLQQVARDLADMAAQVEQLKASIAELRASQQAMAIAKPAEVKPADVKPLVANPRPKVSAPPPRPAATPLHKPVPAYYPPVQAAAPFPQAAPPPASLQPAPPPAATDQDGEPVVRPPMPLH
jgi:hypothetical protein